MSRFSRFAALLLIGGALASTSPALGAAGQDAANPLKLDIALKTVPAAGQDKFEVTIKDASGKPVTDADVSLQLTMTAMPTRTARRARGPTAIFKSFIANISSCTCGRFPPRRHWRSHRKARA